MLDYLVSCLELEDNDFGPDFEETYEGFGSMLVSVCEPLRLHAHHLTHARSTSCLRPCIAADTKRSTVARLLALSSSNPPLPSVGLPDYTAVPLSCLAFIPRSHHRIHTNQQYIAVCRWMRAVFLMTLQPEEHAASSQRGSSPSQPATTQGAVQRLATATGPWKVSLSKRYQVFRCFQYPSMRVAGRQRTYRHSCHDNGPERHNTAGCRTRCKLSRRETESRCRRIVAIVIEPAALAGGKALSFQSF